MFDLLFNLFSINIILCAVFVITSKNPIHSVLFLVLVFLNGSSLILLHQIDFLGLILIIVYVGAIAVLFLFIVMLLNIRLIEYNDTFFKYFPIGTGIGIIFLLEISIVYDNYFVKALSSDLFSNSTNWVNYIFERSQAQTISYVLYYTHPIYLILASLILLVAMIGSIYLTYKLGQSPKRQHIYKQLLRNKQHIINYI